MSKYLDLDGLTLFKSKNDNLYATKAALTTLDGRVTVAETDIDNLEVAMAGKQATLTAGNNITISNNTISATDTTYTAGAGISINGTVISCTAGLKLHICVAGEYDPTTRIPTIQNPDTSTIYLVPKSTAASNNSYDEWIYTNSAWEKIGSTEVTIETISNAEINALFA